nr:hypothetical protein CFP56_63027 [Quercus suber]
MPTGVGYLSGSGGWMSYEAHCYMDFLIARMYCVATVSDRRELAPPNFVAATHYCIVGDADSQVRLPSLIPSRTGVLHVLCQKARTPSSPP